MEVESRVKLSTGERERLIAELTARQIILAAPVGQRDVYYKERGFRDRVHGPGSAIIRVRYTPSEVTLNMKRLTGHDGVSQVYYPGLSTHTNHDVAARQMKRFGGMVSFRLKKGEDAAVKACAAVQLWTLGESLGGVESLIEHPARMTHASVAGTELEVPADYPLRRDPRPARHRGDETRVARGRHFVPAGCREPPAPIAACRPGHPRRATLGW